ncbi:MAG: stage II sporulation protein M [Thermoprotei archaeon]
MMKGLELYRDHLFMLRQDLDRGLISQGIYDELAEEFFIALRLNGYEPFKVKSLRARFVDFILFKYPKSIFDNAVFILLSFFIYLLGFLFGSLRPFNLILNTNNTVSAQYSSFVLFIQIFMNNLRVQSISFVLSLLADVPTVFTTFANGFILGLVYSYYPHGFLEFWSLILPHGVLELTAMITSFGASLGFGYRFLKSFSLYGSHEALRKATDTALNVMLGSSILLFVAAFIEAYFTSSPLDPVTKLIFSLIMFMVIVFYLVYSWLKIKRV